MQALHGSCFEAVGQEKFQAGVHALFVDVSLVSCVSIGTFSLSVFIHLIAGCKKTELKCAGGEELRMSPLTTKPTRWVTQANTMGHTVANYSISA